MNTSVFSVQDRDRVREHVLQLAATDARVVAGAMVGSLALGEGDRWSDLDLTFGVADDVSLLDVLEDWTRNIVAAFNAVQLFDLPSGASIYRVFLLPGCMQFDLSFTPASQFGALGPKFKLLFGNAVDKPIGVSSSAHELFGYAVHHALRARFCIERGRYWQAEYWISSTRDYALSMACLRLGLPTHYGRGVDALPFDVHERFRFGLVTSLERDELLRALSHTIEGLVREASVSDIQALAVQVEPQLRQLTVAWG